MASSEPALFCASCGVGNTPESAFCFACGTRLELANSPTVEHLAFLLNELTSLREEGVVDQRTHDALRGRYEERLHVLAASRSSVPAPSMTIAEEVQPNEPDTQMSVWFGEQAPNLLLYMGAFLVVIAGLIALNIFALFPLTLAFLVAGWFFRRLPRVALAGNTYLLVGALLTPVNFLSAYLFLNALVEDRPALDLGSVIWLGGSAYSTMFYGFFARIGLGRLYAWLAAGSLVSAWTAGLFILGVPAEWSPPFYIALGLGLAAAPWLSETNTVRVAFSGTASLFSHVLVPTAALFSVAIHGIGDHGFVNHWALPVSLALAMGFYVVGGQRVRVTQLIAGILAGATVLSIVHALGVTDAAVFGVVLAVLGLAYGTAWHAPQLAAWPGRPLLWPIGLSAATLAGLSFIEPYSQRPLLGASALFTATATYLVAAWQHGWRDQIRRELSQDDGTETAPTGMHKAGFDVVEPALLYAAGIAVSVGYFFVFNGVPAIALTIPNPGEDAGDLSLAYFPLSLAVAGVGLLAGRTVPPWRFHLLGVATVISIFVLLADPEGAGRIALYAGTYASLALAIAVCERRPSLTYLALPYAFVAVVGLLRWLEPVEPLWPLLPMLIAVGIYGGGWTLGRFIGVGAWTRMVQYAGIAFAVMAPAIGIGRLIERFGADWLVFHYFDHNAVGGGLSLVGVFGGSCGIDPVQTHLHDATAVTLAVLGGLIAAQAIGQRSINLSLGAATALMIALLATILRFQPDNIQYVSVSSGLYLSAVVVVLGRYGRRYVAPWHLSLFSSLVGAAGVIVLAPTFAQSVLSGAFEYRTLMLVQGLAVFVAGLAFHQRMLVAASVGFLGAAALLQIMDVARALPNWAILTGSGLFLLAGGTVLLFRQDLWRHWQVELRAWWDR